MLNKAAAPVVKDSIRVQFDTTAADDQAGWTIIRGNPAAHIISASGGLTNSIAVSTISIDANAWLGIGGSCMYPGNGASSTQTVFPYAPNVMLECVFTLSTYNASFPQVQISGLNPASTYSLKLTGTLSTGLGFAAIGEYRVLGNTLLSMQTLDARPGGVENTSSSLTFGPITPDGSGNIFIYFTPQSGQQLAALSAFVLKEN